MKEDGVKTFAWTVLVLGILFFIVFFIVTLPA